MRSIKKTNKNDVLIAFILGIASVSAKAQNVTETLADSVQLKEVIVTQRLRILSIHSRSGKARQIL